MARSAWPSASPARTAGEVAVLDLAISLHKAPGDTVVLTGFLRDLQRAYPGRYRVWASVNHPELLAHCPWVHAAGRWEDCAWPPGFLVVAAEYGRGIVAQNRETVHFLAWFHRDFGRKTGIHVPVSAPTPSLVLSAAEETPPMTGRYWVVVAGGKSDATVKIWPRREWQRTVGDLHALGLGVVQCGSRAPGHIHHTLEGTLDLVGRTSLRDMLRLIRHADGVICGVTFAMHAAAALARPCVVVAGGREAWWWEAYVDENRGFGPSAGPVPVPHKYLHTIGLLPCCESHGCWKNKVVPPDRNGRVCTYPDVVDTAVVPRCMSMITHNHVEEAVVGYYEDRTLPPVDAPRHPTLIVPLEGPGVAAAPAFRPRRTPPPHDGMTAFVLMYGDYPAIHRECLDALIATTPADAVELRVLSNRLCDASRRHVDGLVAAGVVRLHAADDDNPGKYPAMRAAFRDPAAPIETDYLLWLDDDTICDRDPGWFRALVALVAREHPKGARMFGPVAHIGLRPGQAEWIRSAPWYSGRPFRDRRGRETPAGDRVHFCTGSFWALHVPTMRECDIPDPRVVHNGGDVMIGEQLHQAGHRIAAFSNNRSAVRWSAYPRRGRDEEPAGAAKLPPATRHTG
jgi:hypothetical protein